MQRKRVTYLHQYFNLPNMAGGTRSYEMAKRLVVKGFEVHMITSDRENPGFKGWRSEIIDGIHIHWVSVPYSNNMSFIRRIKSFLKFAWHASAKSMSLKSDLVFATSTPLTIAIPAILASKKLRVPLVFEVRDLWPELPIAIGALKSRPLIWIATKMERLAYRHSAYVIGCSPGMCEGIIRTGVDQATVYEIPNSCDISTFSDKRESGLIFREERDWLSERPLVVYAGTFGKINGVSYIVDLAAEMRSINSNVRFLAVGDGLEKEKVVKLAKERGVYNVNMYFLSKQPKESVPAIYSAATVVMSMFLPIKEMESNSANKFFDALAAGKPVAINYGGWQAELINKNKIGIVLDYSNIENSAIRLNEMLNDEIQIEKMGERSSSLAKNSFSRDHMAEKLADVLDQALYKS